MVPSLFSYICVIFFFFLQELVNQNKIALRSSEGNSESTTYTKDSMIPSSSVASYSKKTAIKNIRALGSCSLELLQALTELFFDSPPEKRSYLKVFVSLFSLKYFIYSLTHPYYLE